MHRTSVDRYVRFNEDVWRVVCERCGVVADNLGRSETPFVETYLAAKECGPVATGDDRLVPATSDCA